MVMKMAVDYDCIHESLIQGHSTDIQSLKTRADYKDKRIDDLYEKIEKMEEKIDKMNDNINQLILKSTQGDTKLELRLTAIETEQATLKKQISKKEDESDRITSLETTVRVLKWVISILIAVIPILIALNIIK